MIQEAVSSIVPVSMPPPVFLIVNVFEKLVFACWIPKSISVGVMDKTGGSGRWYVTAFGLKKSSKGK